MQRKELSRMKVRDASKLKVGIVVAQFNKDITDELLSGAQRLLKEWKVSSKNVTLLSVSGSFELPVGAQSVAAKKKPHAIIALGCIVKGETEHDRHIASAVSHGLTEVSLRFGIPVSFGVLTVNTIEQAKARSSKEANHGYFAAAAALSAALDIRSL